MIIAHAFGLPMTAVTALIGAIIATWTAAILQAVVIQGRLSREIPAGPRNYQSGVWLSTAAPIWLISAADLVLQNTDVIFLTMYAKADTVGVYYAALKTISLIAFVNYAVGSAISSRLSTQNTRGDKTQLLATVHDAVNWTFWPSLFGAVLLLLAGGPLLSLFGPEFASGYPAMLILVIGLLVRASVGPAEFMLRMLGAQEQCAYVLGGSALLNIVLNFVLVPRFGLLGAATATSLSLVAATIAFAYVAQRVLKLDISIWSAARALRQTSGSRQV